jgi:hypothetical protein
MGWVGDYGDGSEPIPLAQGEDRRPRWRVKQYRLRLAPECNHVQVPIHPGVQYSVAMEDGDPFLYVFADVNQRQRAECKFWVVVDEAVVSVGGDNFLQLLGTVTQKVRHFGVKGEQSERSTAYHIFKEYT